MDYAYIVIFILYTGRFLFFAGSIWDTMDAPNFLDIIAVLGILFLAGIMGYCAVQSVQRIFHG